jgi:WD40 repeat protein
VSQDLREWRAHLWRAETGELLMRVGSQQWPVLICRWSPDGRYLASGELGRTVVIWPGVPHSLEE